MEPAANGSSVARVSVVSAAHALRLNALHAQTVRRAEVVAARASNQTPVAGSAQHSTAATATATATASSDNTGGFFL